MQYVGASDISKYAIYTKKQTSITKLQQRRTSSEGRRQTFTVVHFKSMVHGASIIARTGHAAHGNVGHRIMPASTRHNLHRSISLYKRKSKYEDSEENEIIKYQCAMRNESMLYRSKMSTNDQSPTRGSPNVYTSSFVPGITCAMYAAAIAAAAPPREWPVIKS